jgi:diguanylate cyclase (GGDEF)-like protein
MIEPIPATSPPPLDADVPPAGAVGVATAAVCTELLRMTRTKLRDIAGSWFATAPELQMHHTARRIRADILDCVLALERLQSMLVPEDVRFRQFESELDNTRASLAEARAELAELHADDRSAGYASLHDSLTSLPNRSHFRQELAHAVARARRSGESLSVFHMDLDAFKPLNDLHGHDTGDQILKIVGTRLSRVVRAEDMVSRMGGDEFACLLLGLPHREQLLVLAAKLHKSVSEPIKIGDLELSIRPSIGIATFPDDGSTPESLLKSADVAMYRAKRQKTGHALFAERS